MSFTGILEQFRRYTRNYTVNHRYDPKIVYVTEPERDQLLIDAKLNGPYVHSFQLLGIEVRVLAQEIIEILMAKLDNKELSVMLVDPDENLRYLAKVELEKRQRKQSYESFSSLSFP